MHGQNPCLFQLENMAGVAISSQEKLTFTFCLGDSASIAIMPVKSQSGMAVLCGRSGYSESVRSACSYHTACGRQSPRTAHRPSGLH